MPRPKIRQRAHRAKHWLVSPLHRGEAAAVSLVSVAIILAFGALERRELVPILGIALLVGLAVRAVGFCCATRSR